MKFTQAVDKADAEKANQVVIAGVTLSNPSLSADGKTLTFDALMTSGSNKPVEVKNATVTVEPIQTKADANVKTPKHVSLLTYKDEVAPTITSVESKTNGTHAKTATVNLSEPVKTGVLVKVDGNHVSPSAFTGTSSDKLELTGLNLEAGKSHTVEVLNAEDLAGNKTVSQSATFTVSVDAVAPTATVSAGGSDKEILVTFSKSMNPTSVTSKLVNGIVKSESLGAISSKTAVVVPDTDNKQFTIAVDQATIFADKATREFSVVLPKDIEDELGNKSAESVQKVTLKEDTVKPVATGYKVVKTADDKIKSIEINFSEGLVEDSVVTGTTLHAAAPSIVDANGILDTTTFADYKAEKVKAGDKKVVFKAAAGAEKEIYGKYAISFKKDLVTDQSEGVNKSDAFNYTIDFGQAKTDAEFELVTAPSVSGKVITVTYPTKVKGGAVAGSATDLANYTLGGKPLPTGTTITLEGTQQEATITLPDNSIAKDETVVFTVANVKDTAGTKTVKSYANTLAVKDNISPVLDSAKVLDTKTIELTYSEAIQIDDALTNKNLGDSFVIKQGDTVLDLTNAELTGTVASGFDKKLVLTIAKNDTIGAVAATATKSGASASKVTLTNQTSASADKTVNYAVVDNGGTLELQDTSDNSVVIADLSSSQSTTLNGVTIAIAGAANGDTFTVETKAAVAGTTQAVTLDLTKNITIETKAATPKKVVDKSAAKNEHKAAVKVNVTKP